MTAPFTPITIDIALMALAGRHTNTRKGLQGLALLVQQSLSRNPHGRVLSVFRGWSGALVKIIWHDGNRQHRVTDGCAIGLPAG